MVDRPGATDNEITDDGEPSPLGAAAPVHIGGGAGPGSGGGSGGGEDAPAKPRKRLPRPGLWTALIVVAVIVGLAFVPMFVAGLKKTPRDRVGISYGGGPIEGVHFQRIVKPGSTLFFNGFYDPLYLYPSDQVNYIISKKPGVGAQNGPDSIVAPTKDRVQVTYQVAVYFKLNVDKLQEFHEQFGLRYNAYTSSGWYNLIRDTFRQQIENALQEETRRVEVADLFSNADQLVAVQGNVQDKLTQKLKETMGGDFFCSPTYKPGGPCGNPTFIIKKVDVPPSIAAAYEANRSSAIAVLTKQNEVAQRQAEAQSIARVGALRRGLRQAPAIESGKTNFWILDGSGNITVPANPGGSSSTTTPSGG